jgi:hypothetical protein
MKEKLANRGVPVETDEIQELEQAVPAWEAWIKAVELLAAAEPIFVRPPEDTR